MTDKELVSIVSANAEKMRSEKFLSTPPKWLRYGLRVRFMEGQEADTLSDVIRGHRTFSRGKIGVKGSEENVFFDLLTGSTAVAVRDPWECKASRLYQVVDESLFSQ